MTSQQIVRVHGDGLVYKAYNPFADPKENRPVFLICDLPHLIKTTRNCLSHLDYSGTRLIEVSTEFNSHLCLSDQWQIHTYYGSIL